MQCFISAFAESLSLQTQQHLTTSRCLTSFKIFFVLASPRNSSLKPFFIWDWMFSRLDNIDCDFFSFYFFSFFFFPLPLPPFPSPPPGTEYLKGQPVDHSIGPWSHPQKLESWGILTQLMMSCLYFSICFNVCAGLCVMIFSVHGGNRFSVLLHIKQTS